MIKVLKWTFFASCLLCWAMAALMEFTSRSSSAFIQLSILDILIAIFFSLNQPITIPLKATYLKEVAKRAMTAANKIHES